MLKTKANGVELAYERYGKGTPLVLLHGHPLDHTIWEPVLPLLKDDFDLIVPDLRGFGRSETIQIGYSLEDMAADIASLLDHLEIKQATVVGHSMGGYIALVYGRVYSDRIRGMGLVASQIFADLPERRSLRYETASEIEKVGVNVIAETFPAKLSVNLSLQKQLRETILRQSVHGVAESLRAMAGRMDSSDLVVNSIFPIVVVHGTQDALIPIERARDAKKLSTKIHLVEIDGAGHMPMMEESRITADALKMLR